MWDSKAAAASSEFSATMTMRIFGRSCLISDAMVELSLRAKLNRAENCKAFHGSCLDLRLGSMEESNCVFLTSWTVLFARCASASRSGARTLRSNSEQISTRVEGTFINFMRRSS